MDENPDKNLLFGYYFVAFVDLLGQRDKLKNLNSLPENKDCPEYRIFIDTIKETVVAVKDLQSHCKMFFDTFEITKNESPFKDKPELEKLNKTQIKFQNFSDGLVIYIPLMPKGDYSPMRGLYAALAACGGLFLISLAGKKPIRIGISIGIGTEINNNEIYGKVVADAYEAESILAEYPRILIQNEVVDYLTSYANQNCEDNNLICKFESTVAEACLKLLSNDFDGRIILNYLGDYFKNNMMNGIDANIYHEAYHYVHQQLINHQKTQNTKLAFRYSLLHGYFHEHLGKMKEPEM